MTFVRIVFFCLFWVELSFTCLAQGQGGGIWLEDNAFSIGNVIYNNLAKDGFGVAGGNGVLLNCSVVENELLAESDYYPKAGDIYCADGDIVSIEAYKSRADKNAIGIVFWVNADQTVTYPKGAVLALTGQVQKRWGDYTLWISEPKTQEEEDDKTVIPLRDTACYTNTKRMYNLYQAGKTEFAAGYHCWTYHFDGQPDQIQWCMPTLTFLRRLFQVKMDVKQTIQELQTLHPAWGVQGFEDDMILTAYYWSLDDRVDETENGFAFCINMKNGVLASKGGINPSDAGAKGNANWVRPIFIYGL